MAKRRDELQELRKLSDADLAKELEETHRQAFTLRLQVVTRQQANTALPGQTRKRIARIKTLQREREIAALYEAATTGDKA
ncbi:MAG: 50S ribosomal protein L29 [Dehalococcoidia bacterium]